MFSTHLLGLHGLLEDEATVTCSCYAKHRHGMLNGSARHADAGDKGLADVGNIANENNEAAANAPAT